MSLWAEFILEASVTVNSGLLSLFIMLLSSVLSWRYERRDPLSCLAPLSLASGATPESGRETWGVTGSSFGSPYLASKRGLKGHNTVVLLLRLNHFHGHLDECDYSGTSPLDFDVLMCDRTMLSFPPTLFLNSRDISCLFPPSGAAVRPVRGSSGGRRHLWLWRQHHWGTVCAVDAAWRLLPIHEKSQRQAQCCEKHCFWGWLCMLYMIYRYIYICIYTYTFVYVFHWSSNAHLSKVLFQQMSCGFTRSKRSWLHAIFQRAHLFYA